MLSACKKTADSPAPTSSRTDLLVAKNWRLSTVNITLNGFPIPSNLVVQECLLDDFYKFNPDKTLLQDAGATKCSPTDPQTLTGTWTLSNDQNKLTIAVSGSPLNGTADIKELTASTLHIYGTPSLNGITYTLDATFVPK
jgi:hypothetical protein